MSPLSSCSVAEVTAIGASYFGVVVKFLPDVSIFIFCLNKFIPELDQVLDQKTELSRGPQVKLVSTLRREKLQGVTGGPLLGPGPPGA